MALSTAPQAPRRPITDHDHTTQEVRASFPWLTKEIIISDQCADYHSTASTIFNHEQGRVTGLSVVQVDHTEVGEGKGEVDMKFGQLSMKFQCSMATLNRECASDLFEHLERARVGYNMETRINR